MELKKIMVVWIIIGFALINLIIGYRIGGLDNSCNKWLDKTSDRSNNIPDWIDSNQIFVTPDKLIIEGKYVLSEFVDSNSMLPTLDYGSNGVHIIYDRDMKLEVGDIISYKYEKENYSIIHRIVDLGVDSKGNYYITQGDNREGPDPFKVREDQIERVMVGVIW